MIDRCSLCDIEAELVEAIGQEEIVRVCNHCAEKNNFPIVRRPSVEQIKAENQSGNIRERLSTSAGIEIRKPISDLKEDKELKKIVVESVKPGDYDDLVDNFHWHIQHARRLKKISQKQLGENIAEPEIIIAMAEKKQLPDNYEKVVSKLEQYLGIKLFKIRPTSLTGISQGGFDIKKADLGSVTIKDLKEMKEKETIVEEKLGQIIVSKEIEIKGEPRLEEQEIIDIKRDEIELVEDNKKEIELEESERQEEKSKEKSGKRGGFWGWFTDFEDED